MAIAQAIEAAERDGSADPLVMPPTVGGGTIGAVRAFLAVVPPLRVLEHLDDHLQPRRDADGVSPSWRWTRPEHLHLTLAFLADLPDWRVEELVTGLTDWGARHTRMSMSLGQAGAFPAPDRAKVLWVGVAEPEVRQTLTEWSMALRGLCNHHGAPPDGQRFTPHVTVARSGRARCAGRWVQALDAYRSPAFDVTEVSLLQSHLGEGPGRTPRYEVVHQAQLALGG